VKSSKSQHRVPCKVRRCLSRILTPDGRASQGTRQVPH